MNPLTSYVHETVWGVSELDDFWIDNTITGVLA